jgi:hypothetical protein
MSSEADANKMKKQVATHLAGLVFFIDGIPLFPNSKNESPIVLGPSD